MATKDRDWYRNEDWNAEVAAAFEAKLRRARKKSQYLRIQASCLANRRPEVALALLDRYFALGDHFDLAQALVDQATAHLARHETDAALASLQRALAREREMPNFQTQAWCEYAELVVSLPRPDLFDDVIAVLDERRSVVAFPVQEFVLHAARAIIYDRRGRPGAREAAVHALRVAEARSSGLVGHPDLGLVGRRYEAMRSRLQMIASAGGAAQ